MVVPSRFGWLPRPTRERVGPVWSVAGAEGSHGAVFARSEWSGPAVRTVLPMRTAAVTGRLEARGHSG